MYFMCNTVKVLGIRVRTKHLKACNGCWQPIQVTNEFPLYKIQCFFKYSMRGRVGFKT